MCNVHPMNLLPKLYSSLTRSCFICKLDQGRICGQMQNVFTSKGKSSYYSAMPRAGGLKFYYVIADPKVGE